MDETSPSTGLTFKHGLWLGLIPSPYGAIELVLGGTREAPDEHELAAVQAFMPHAGDTVKRLRRKMRFWFLWRPVRLAVNNEHRVGIQFQHRLFKRRELLFADES